MVKLMVKLVVKLMVMIHVFDSWGSQSWRRPNLKTKFRGVLKFEVSQTFRQRTPQKNRLSILVGSLDILIIPGSVGVVTLMIRMVAAVRVMTFSPVGEKY